MQTQLNIRPIRAAEAPIAKALVFRVAHEMMETETPFESFRALWDSWGVFDDLHDIATSYELKDGAFRPKTQARSWEPGPSFAMNSPGIAS